ncbi:DnaJ domain-containing protein [bacterium]|jgi:curved DNA-binding protein|nr:DnaJ domain-containing protein [bacterium]
MAKDFYSTLGVSKTASEAEIKKAYRKLARENHPDLHPNDKNAETRFKEVQEAYDILCDKEKREKYDRFGSAAFEQGFPGGAGGRTASWGPGQPGAGGQFEFGGMEDILQNIFGAKGRHKSPFGSPGGGGFSSPKGRDVETELSVPFRIALLGGSIDIELSGRQTEKLSVTIPPGVTDGSRLRLAGKGEPGAGGIGDLIVIVHVDADPHFTREGNDVQIEVPVTIGEAVLGATIDVPTLEGTISLAIPPGSSSGQRLRLRSKGGKTRSGERGDLYIRIKILVPPNLDDESRRLIAEFEKRNPFSPRSFH